MECNFQVGDAVVCVQEVPPNEAILSNHRGPVLNEIYHIREVGMWRYTVVCPFVRLKEIILSNEGPNGVEMAYVHTIFRKLLTIDDFMSVDTVAPVDSKDKVPEHA